MWEQMSPRVYRNLDEIFAGEYEGRTYEDIKRLQPDEVAGEVETRSLHATRAAYDVPRSSRRPSHRARGPAGVSAFYG